jgi:hypothetical protein
MQGDPTREEQVILASGLAKIQPGLAGIKIAELQPETNREQNLDRSSYIHACPKLHRAGVCSSWRDIRQSGDKAGAFIKSGITSACAQPRAHRPLWSKPDTQSRSNKQKSVIPWHRRVAGVDINARSSLERTSSPSATFLETGQMCAYVKPKVKPRPKSSVAPDGVFCTAELLPRSRPSSFSCWA